MRVGIVVYPMLFQHAGGLRDQVRATLDAFSRMRSSPLYGPVEVVLADPQRECLDEYDVIHVIGSENGNHAIVETAAAFAVPVVLTPLIDTGWQRTQGARARLADRLLARLIGNAMQSSHSQLRRALDLATVVVAQSGAERRAVAAAFQTNPAKLRVVPQGVDRLFFEADAALFRLRTGIKSEFAAVLAPLSSPYRQLDLARALQEMAVPLVLIGAGSQGDALGHGNAAWQDDAAYVQQLRAMPGVSLLGDLDGQPRLRASALAAARMLIMPPGAPGCSQATLGALQALAAGTPVLADHAAASAFALPESEAGVRLLRWNDCRARKSTIVSLLDKPPLRERVRGLVRDHAWDQIAARLLHCYADAMTARGSSTGVYPGPSSVRIPALRAAR